MSSTNIVNIQLTKFIDLDQGKETDASYGYRIFDDYSEVYSDRFDTLEQLNEKINISNFWEILDEHQDFVDIDDSVCSGIQFNDVYYSMWQVEKMQLEAKAVDILGPMV